jgi:hypothetical protein
MKNIYRKVVKSEYESVSNPCEQVRELVERRTTGQRRRGVTQLPFISWALRVDKEKTHIRGDIFHLSQDVVRNTGQNAHQILSENG